MPVVTLGEIIRLSKNPGILGSESREVIIDYVSRAMELAIYKANWNPSIGTLDTCADACGYVTLPHFVDTVLACNVNGVPSWPQNRWYEFSLNGAGSSAWPGNAGYAGAGFSPWGGAFTGMGGVGNAWMDRGWTPTFQNIENFSCLACITEDAADGQGDKFLIVEGEHQTPQGTEPVWTTTGAGSPFPGVKVPMLASMATTDAQGIRFKNITRIHKPITVGCVKLFAFEPKQGAMMRLVGHYTQRETEPQYRRIRVTAQGGWVRIMYRMVKPTLLYDTDEIPVASVEAMLMLLKAVRMREAAQLTEAQVYEQMAAQTIAEIQSVQDGPAVIPLNVDPGSTLGTVALY